jgi:hypothetical protein
MNTWRGRDSSCIRYSRLFGDRRYFGIRYVYAKPNESSANLQGSPPRYRKSP